MKSKCSVILLSASMFMSGCAMNTNEAQGGVIGGIVGGIAGSQFGKGDGKVAMAAAGAIIGSLVGSNIGKGMDERDRQMMSQTTQQATTAPIGQEITWQNQATGNHGSVTPIKEGKDKYGRDCRQVSQTIVIDGKSEQAISTVCKSSDGQWYIIPN